jgi:hypothetical protein
MLTVFIHEVFGHGLFTLLLGGIFSAFYLSPQGFSFAFYGWRYGMGVTPLMNGLVWAGGLIMESILGVVVLLLYSRIHGFTSRIFALILIYQSLFHAAYYLGAGSIAPVLGITSLVFDPVGIHHYLGIPYWVLFGVALVVGVLSMYLFFSKIIELLQEYFMFRGKIDLFVSILMIIVVNWALGTLITAVLGDSSILDLVAFAGLMAIVIPVGMFTTWRRRLPDKATLKHLHVSIRFFAIFSILALISTTVWLGVFGSSYTRAHGILLEEYPAYCNVKIEVSDDKSAAVDFSFRPPIDQAWQSIKERDNWALYLEVASMFVERMFNVSQYEIIYIETTNDAFWKGDVWSSGGARRIRVRLALSDSPNWQRIDSDFSLTIADPLKPDLFFLDAVNITSTGYTIVDYDYTPATAMDVTRGSIKEGYLLWLNSGIKENPETYIIKLVR